jgi:hypothetical protein
MYNGSTILLCVTIFVIHNQCLIRAHCSIVTVCSAPNMIAKSLIVCLPIRVNARWGGVKIVQIHNITKKPAKIYVLSLYNFDAM